MAEFFQQVVAGLATGSIFAALALALVLIHRATGVINFAQGEMAMFTTYIAWTLIENHGMNEWLAFGLTLVIAFGLGLGTERVVIRPIERAPLLTTVIVTIGLVLIFNGLVSLIWTAEVRAFPSPFPNDTWEIGGVAISQQDVGTFLTVLADGRRSCGRSSSSRRSAWRCARPRSTPRRAGSSASASAGCSRSAGGSPRCSARSRGCSTAPTVFLDPNMMQAVLIYAFAAAVLGGIDSPFGAVAGGLMLGVGLNLIGDLHRLRRRRPAAAGRAADHPRRPARQAVRPLRQADHEARVKRSDLTGARALRLAAAAIFLLPRFVSDFRAQQFAYVGIYFIALLGLNVLTGYTGQISLGHGAFMAIGGYTTAILVSDQGLKLGAHTFSADVKDVWTIPLAGLVAGPDRLRLRLPRAAAVRPLPRARDVRDRGGDAGADQVRALRAVHRRRRRDQPVRVAAARAWSRRPIRSPSRRSRSRSVPRARDR